MRLGVHGSWQRLLRRVFSRAPLVALGLPLAPLLFALLARPVPRFVVNGDYAGLEIATRFVPTGTTLLGPYSRFGWNHPGPLYFVLLAPIHALFGGTSTGIFAGALGVRLGGTNVYGGVAEKRPSLGDGRAPEPGEIGRAVRLSRAVTAATAAVAVLIAITRGGRRNR